MTNPATAALHDPSTFTRGVPFGLLEELRGEGPVHWVDEPALPGLPAGSGYHLVIDHAAVTDVVKDPATYSSAIGGTQIQDPATPRDLAYVRRMMLNMDPPEHTRLRTMIAASFTPRAVRALEDRIAGHARQIVDRMLDGPAECDFAKDVAADLPLLTLADILGVPSQDRRLMFDWSNRVIGFLDPDYAGSASFDAAEGTSLAREAVALRPSPDADGRMPDPRGRDGMPDLYRYAHLLADAKRAHPDDDVVSVLLAQGGECGRLTTEEFENMFWLFAVAGNETLRNGLPGAMIGLLEHPDAQTRLRQDPSLIPVAVDELLRWWTPVMTFRRTATHATELYGTPIRAGDKVVVSYLGSQSGPGRLRSPGAARHHAKAQQSPGVRAWTARVRRRAFRAHPDDLPAPGSSHPHQRCATRRRTRLSPVELPAGRQAPTRPLEPVSNTGTKSTGQQRGSCQWCGAYSENER